MKKPAERKVSLGALVAALFEEAKKVTANRFEQNVLVYVALKDMVRSNRSHIHGSQSVRDI